MSIRIAPLVLYFDCVCRSDLGVYIIAMHTRSLRIMWTVNAFDGDEATLCGK